MSKADDYDTPMQEAELNVLYRTIVSLKSDAAIALAKVNSLSKEIEKYKELCASKQRFAECCFQSECEAKEQALRDAARADKNAAEASAFREAGLKLRNALSKQRMWNANLEWMAEVTGKLGPFTVKDFHDAYEACGETIHETDVLFCTCNTSDGVWSTVTHFDKCPARKP